MGTLSKANKPTVDRRFDIVPVSEWGCDVKLRSLTETEYHDFRDSTLSRAGKDVEVNARIMRACLLAACIVDPEDDKPFLTVDELMDRNARAIALLFRRAAQLNGMDDEDIADVLKNCERARPAVSP